MKFDVIILGAGPAGLFAAEKLSGKNLRVLIIDKGKDINDSYEQIEMALIMYRKGMANHWCCNDLI